MADAAYSRLRLGGVVGTANTIEQQPLDWSRDGRFLFYTQVTWSWEIERAIFGQKKFKSKNLKTLANLSTLRVLAGIQNSCPGQQCVNIRREFGKCKPRTGTTLFICHRTPKKRAQYVEFRARYPQVREQNLYIPLLSRFQACLAARQYPASAQ